MTLFYIIFSRYILFLLYVIKKCIYHIVGPVDCFQFSAVLNTVIDMLIGKSVCTSMVISLRQIPDSGVCPFLRLYIYIAKFTSGKKIHFHSLLSSV